MDLQAASGPSAVLERDGGAPEFQRALQPIMSMDDQAAVHEAIENHRYNPGELFFRSSRIAARSPPLRCAEAELRRCAPACTTR